MAIDERLAQTFVELADTLVADFDLMEFLHTLTEQCVQLLDADAAGLLLADGRGALRLVAASTDQAQVIELFQLQADEGPCLDCYRSGQIVGVGDLRSAEATRRWPGFADASTEMGFGGVHAIPMRLRDEIIGTLNLFHAAAAGPDPVTARVARSLVDVATIGLLQERALRHQEILTEQLQTALNSRVLIEQAKGILAERHGFDPERAFTVLRHYARNHNHPLTALACDVITGAVQITDTMTST
ncbi:MAG: GAF and ANTAR domain-containing protein [Pseudonocardiaceae bacterium]